VLSDHADWPGLLEAIGATGAQRVIVTHGSIAVLVRWLQAQGLQASGFDTEYGDDEADDAATADSAAAPADGAAAPAAVAARAGDSAAAAGPGLPAFPAAEGAEHA
jgi:putative mRNA 3-end processing factor